MKRKKLILLTFILILAASVYWASRHFNLFQRYEIGEVVDSLHGVKVYYNGSIDNITGRNLSADGYNIGLKYQCVEFVKRYYYQHLKHKMPDASGHAVDFFDRGLKDGAWNKRRQLRQYSNPGKTKPKEDDLLVYSGKYGHVAIVSAVSEDEIEVIQQNAGPFGKSRVRFRMEQRKGTWHIENERILGWLRKE